MTISSETIEQVRLATDIVDLVREYIPTIKRSGRNWKANCPFHNEKTASFMVSVEKNIFHCFGCHAGGDVFKFVMMIDNLSWPEAIKKLALRAGIVIKETKDDVLKRSEKQKIYDLLFQTANFYNRALQYSNFGAKAREYLKTRGVNKETIEKFQLGFAPYGKLIQSALTKGFTHEQLLSSGLITKTERGNYYEYMSERLVFPIYDLQGRVVAFGGRILKEDGQPKYLNTPETIVYSKSQQLYGLYQAIPLLRHKKEVIILEGYMDVVMAHQFEIFNSAATLGTAFTLQQSHIINRYVDKVVLLFDSDKAGNNAAIRAIDILIDSEISLRVANLPEGIDPDEYLLKEGKENFLQLISSKNKSGIEFLCEYAISLYGFAAPEAKTKCVAEIIPLLSKVKNAVLRQEYIKYIAYRLQTTEQAIINELNRFYKSSRREVSVGKKQKAQATIVRSAEEEILQILVACPQCVKIVNEDVFKHERNRRLYSFLVKGISVTDIIQNLDESDLNWFTALIFEDKNYSSPEQMLITLLKDLEQHKLESERKLLEIEVTLMINGKIPSDSYKIQQYNELTKLLKGSVK